MQNDSQHPRYIRIAIDVAKRIIDNKLIENQKIKGRSVLAAEYSVSPETIRRAMALLSEMEVVEILPNSGIIIKSKEKAINFTNKFTSKSNIISLIESIKKLVEERNKINEKIQNDIELILEQSLNIKSSEIIQQHEYKIDKDSWIIGKMLTEVKFWQNTGATVIGIKRHKDIIISPGPYFAFEKGDTLYFVGNENITLRVRNLIETFSE